LKKAAPAQVEKPQHEEPKLPTLKHVEHKSAEKVEETKLEHHLKHVEEKHVQEEVRTKQYFCGRTTMYCLTAANN